MWRAIRILGFLTLVLIPWWGMGQASSPQAVLLKIAGPIGPATSDYISRGLKQAKKQQARIIILQMDTPGGLDTSMRKIIQAILASPIPVATFVSPRGARAASAGTYIMYASHIAAMAPGTNLGAATPVKIGGIGPKDKNRYIIVLETKDKKNKTNSKKNGFKIPSVKDKAMQKKIINDATAYIRSLAQMRGRNADWAAKAVRQAASLSAEEALKINVIDFMADGIPQLLKTIHGHKIKIGGKTIRLDTKNLATKEIEPDWQNKFLSVLANPTLIPILMMFGVFGLFYELMNPGYVFPGVLGGICLILGLYASQVLPINYAGLALILLGLAFMVAEAYMPSFGALGIGGVVAFVIGSIMLVDTEIEGFAIYTPAIVAFGVIGGVTFVTLAGFIYRARMRVVVSGKEEMLSSEGRALESFTGKGRVYIHSEEWQAYSSVSISDGQAVRVTGIDGLVLSVEPIQSEE